MDVYAYVGKSSRISAANATTWKSVEIAFKGGRVVSAVAGPSGITPIHGGKFVGVADLSGRKTAIASGHVCTVTFDSPSAEIDFSSHVTAIVTPASGTITWIDGASKLATFVK